ncbi:MAG TPA: hypothetical protein VEP90_25155 [Methylomirabilota bacterium]|nr:hypothetical protein [Methylomirabilota bacterium]
MNIKLLLAACAFGLLLSPAFGQEWTPAETANGARKLEVIRHVPSGKPSTLRNMAWLDIDCSNVSDKWDVSISKQPQNGTIELAPSVFFPDYVKDNPRFKCNTNKVRGQALNYKSSPGYKGVDSFTLLIMYPNGFAEEMVYNINVR